MIRSCSIFVVAILLQVICAQEEGPSDGPMGPYSANDPRQGPLMHPYQERIPRHCWSPPPGVNPHECCPIPKIFSEDKLKACGIEKNPPKGPPPQSPKGQNCSQSMCLLKNDNLLKENDAIDYDKLRAFVDDWGIANSDHKDTIANAKSKCVIEGGPPSPPHICEADKVFFCLTSLTLWNCKLREDVSQCRDLQEHMDECRPYYFGEKSLNIF